jgi:hypothetical protein
VTLAKTSRPTLRRVHPRARLFRRLDEATRNGSAWIVGPAGSGKTTLAASWVQRRPGPTVWLDVDEGDGELATLLHYLGIAAAGVLRGGSLPQFGVELQRGAPELARRFFRELWAAAPPGFALVLDDCHAATRSRAFREALRCAAAERPEGKRLVLASRHEPPPELARFLAEDRLAVIGPAELRLTPEEARSVARLRGARLRGGELTTVHRRVDGWAAGLVLLLQAGPDAALAQPHAGSSPELFDYLVGEVLDGVDPLSRRVLLETALLGSISPGAADALTGVAAAGEVLAGLARRGCFVQRHGGREPVFTFHPLFREVLLARGRLELPPERLAVLRGEAARVLAGRGDLEGAIELLRGAGAVREIAALILAHARRTVAEGRVETLRRWIEELPAEVRAAEPWLDFWLGVSWVAFDPGEVRRALERAFAGAWAKGDPAGSVHALAAMVDTYLTEWGDLHPLDGWGERLAELRRRWPALPDPALEGYLAFADLIVVLTRRPEDPRAEACEARGVALVGGPADPTLRRKTAIALAHLALWRGDLPLAGRMLEVLRAARPQWQERSPTLAWHPIHARWFALRGEGTLARREAEEGLALADSTGAHFVDVGLRGAATLGALVEGDLAAAARHQTRVAPVPGAEGRLDPWYHQFLLGVVEHRRGHADDAERLIAGSQAGAEAAGAPLLALWSEVGRAALARARGDGEAFRAHLDAAEVRGGRARAHVVLWWSRCLRAAALRSEAPRRAAEVFAEALAGWRAHGPFISLFVDDAELAELCSLAFAAGVAPDDVRALVAALALSPPAGAAGAWPYPLVVRALGGLALERDGVPLAFGRKTPHRPLALLSALVALGGKDVPEWRLAELLSPEADGDQAHHALEMNLHRLRRLAGDTPFVERRGGQLSLDPRTCHVDAAALEALLAPVVPAGGDAGAVASAVARLQRAVALYRGPLLAGVDGAPWVEKARARLRRRLRLRLEALGRAGRGAEAAALRSEAAARDPELGG